MHERPPAFEGADGHPYTVSIEVEKVASLDRPYEGYLVFPKWAATGVGIIGHVETPVLWRASTRAEVMAQAGSISLERAKDLLDTAVDGKRD